ncbi:MAG: heavy metal-responsive transcriptional regulator [Anaerolineae bacterium]|nr:heavy metal-responsive transcriptional regulator [Anaerolineae bacterium]
MDGMTRGELAKNCDIHPETVRYYEQQGLVAAVKRTEAGYRLFDDESVRRIRFVKRAQAAGFTLEEIKELLAIQHDPQGTSGSVWHIVDAKITDIDARIRALQSMRQTLVSLLDDCPGGLVPATCCPILEHFDAVDTELSAEAG